MNNFSYDVIFSSEKQVMKMIHELSNPSLQFINVIIVNFEGDELRRPPRRWRVRRELTLGTPVRQYLIPSLGKIFKMIS